MRRSIVNPVVAASRALWAFGDRLIADGIPTVSARMARGLGRGLSSLQTGNAQSYATAIAVGLVFMLIASMFLGR